MLNPEPMRELLDQRRFEDLFRRHLFWDNPPDRLSQLQPLFKSPDAIEDDQALPGRAVAEKRGVQVWVIDCSEIPSSARRRRTVRELKKYSSDQLVVFATPEEQLWLWPEQRPSGTGWRLVDHRYQRGEGNDALLQRLDRVRFDIKESRTLTGPQVLDRVRRSFNVEKVTKRFYTEYKKYHQALTDRIEGIPPSRERDRRWYASVLLNRLKFIYFIQKKGFINGDPNYLKTKLGEVQALRGPDRFYEYFRDFLLPFFHQGLGTPTQDAVWDDAAVERIVGEVPYVDGGIFERHALERYYEISIPDEAFEKIFEFFDQWRWHLDERPSGDHNEINPDILGFIFEQYVNYTEKGRKEKGAYYTKPDVTGYMSTYTIIPAVVDRLVSAGLDDPAAVLLSKSGDRYLHDSLGYGIGKDLPDGELPPSEYPDPDLDIALPGERWCDVTHRRGRYRELVDLVDGGGVTNIDEAITANLDIAGLMEDYFFLASADECRIAFDVLRSLTVCDPTCGSGAFLLAALDVLEPMYTAVYDCMEELIGTGGPDTDLNELNATFSEVRSHPNQRYWLLKTICLNNLFGLDLMGEASEIAKLRLFLKLVAQLDDVSQIEPLPDLDFNIKTGNLLVGIADPEDVARRFGDVLQSFPGLAAAEQAAQLAGDAYGRFTAAQLSEGSAEGVSGKRRLTNQIQAATHQADNTLFDMRGEAGNFEGWKNSHVPFHWFAEFPSVWRHGGFDVVIGNPPYINKKQVTEYTWRGYVTEKCPDLYAVCMERASTLLNPKGRMAMIVMHNLCFSHGFASLREYLSNTLLNIWVSSYDRWSDSLFSGSAKVRNTIVVGNRQGNRGIHTTRCHRWLANYRPALFDLLEYIFSDPILRSPGGLKDQRWPFIDNPILASAFVALVQKDFAITASLVDKTEVGAPLGYRDTADDEIAVWMSPPQSFNPSGQADIPNSDKQLMFRNVVERDFFYIAMAGRWGYLWWLFYGDSFHVTKGVLTSFPGGLVSAGKEHKAKRLAELASALSEESAQHATLKKRGPKGSQWLIGRYDLRKLRHITDEADWLLAQAWGLTREQYEAAGNLRDRMTFGSRD